MIRHPWQRAVPVLILASASTARRSVLEAAGLAFEVIAADVDEQAFKRQAKQAGVDATSLAITLAEAKATQVAQTRPEAIVIGADQVLSVETTYFNKPATLDEALIQLRQLRGACQTLHTAVALAIGGEIIWRHCASPRLRMRDCSEVLFRQYIDYEGEALLSSVGACRIEGPGQMLFETIDGEHSAILGLPLLALLAELRRREVIVG